LRSRPDAPPVHARGTPFSPRNRFRDTYYEHDAELWDDGVAQDDETSRPRKTEFIEDHTRGILSHNNSPDVGFDVSLNPYRGCEHGCVYCYARPTHEYLDYSCGLDFETKILYKPRAAELLRAELLKKSWEPRPIAFSGVTDCYQPVERRMQLTRQCLQVMAQFRNPTLIITKNALVTRDIDLLRDLAEHRACGVMISITTLDRSLQQRLEPRTSPPAARLEALARLREAGIPAGALCAPVIPGINDHEILQIARAVREAGGLALGNVVIRLPFQLDALFMEWLRREYPDRAEKVMNRVRETRSGKTYDAKFGSRMRGEGPLAEQIRQMARVARGTTGLDARLPGLNRAAFRRVPNPNQMELQLG
jgi:DNA repair photolyase